MKVNPFIFLFPIFILVIVIVFIPVILCSREPYLTSEEKEKAKWRGYL